MTFGWIKQSFLLLTAWHVSSVVTWFQAMAVHVFAPEWYDWVWINVGQAKGLAVAALEAVSELWHNLG